MTCNLRVSICVASSITKSFGASLMINLESSPLKIAGFHPLSRPIPSLPLISPVYIALIRSFILKVLAFGAIVVRPSICRPVGPATQVSSS
jgi:hypothetical protein